MNQIWVRIEFIALPQFAVPETDILSSRGKLFSVKPMLRKGFTVGGVYGTRIEARWLPIQKNKDVLSPDSDSLPLLPLHRQRLTTPPRSTPASPSPHPLIHTL
jgi:hypothetical protein